MRYLKWLLCRWKTRRETQIEIEALHIAEPMAMMIVDVLEPDTRKAEIQKLKIARSILQREIELGL